MKKIIVPTDLSNNSANAAEYALALAKQFDASLRLMYVYHPTPVVVNEYTTYIDPELEKVKQEQFDTFTQQLQEKWGTENEQLPTIECDFKQGFAADYIIQISKTEEDAMIVLSSTGDTGTFKKVFGSVSTKVAQSSQAPVLVIPPNVSFQPIKNIAYCTNNEYLDAMVMNQLIAIAKPLDANIHLIHVGNSDNYNGHQLLEAWKNYYPKSKVTLEQVPGVDEVSSINIYCENNGIDMIVMSRGERSFFGHLFHRSVTKNMAINTHLPLIILHK